MTQKVPYLLLYRSWFGTLLMLVLLKLCSFFFLFLFFFAIHEVRIRGGVYFGKGRGTGGFGKEILSGLLMKRSLVAGTMAPGSYGL